MMLSCIPILTLTVPADGALAAERFVTKAGAYPAAGGTVFGVGRTSARAKGDLVPVDVLGTTIVEAGAAITDDAPLMVDAEGRVVPLTAGKVGVARAMGAAAAAGDRIEVLLTPSAVLVA
ncbi:capsid cement protein [Comamonas terrae]|uniref:Capsid cement protein n=1 Tax=Comamonas terrae TaxID=673548 RepID=A0ABW5UPC4_9BURK|nr:capsid cement protein [Comamonas terrae]